MISVAVWVLTGCGVALVLIGVFFLVVRPPLLPEDARYMGSTVEDLAVLLPGLSRWLRRVFWVMGGYIIATGVLVLYVTRTGFSDGGPGSLAVLAIAGLTSLGWMTAVNFVIRSDFRWVLAGLACMWAVGLLVAAAAR